MQTYLNERIEEVLAGSSEPIVVRIFGPDLDTLRKKADEVHDALRGIDGVVDLHTDLQTDIPHIQVRPVLSKAARYGLKPGDIRRIAATLVSGDEVSDIHRNNKVYDIMVWSTPKTRRNVADIRNMLLDTPGGHVRMKDVADVRILPTPNQIEREQDSRRIDVAMAVEGRGLGSVVDEVRTGWGTSRSPASTTPRCWAS